jgi:hypothetical protein
MKPGDLVKIRIDHDTLFDWKSDTSAGYWLRDPKTLSAIKHGRNDFSIDDIGLVVAIERLTMALVLIPNRQMGLIHEQYLEVVSDEG